MVFRRKKKRGDFGKHKFCPVCGRKLELIDTFCTQCGYSFEERRKKRKKTRWINVIIIIIILLGTYFGIRYTSGQSLFPTSFQDAISTFFPNR